MRLTGLLDASSAILLAKAGLFLPLLATFQIIVSESVDAEISGRNHHDSGAYVSARQDGSLLVVPAPPVPENCGPLPGLHSLGKGERDTIGLFAAGAGDFVVTDDGRAARYCRDTGVPFINALLFPRILLFFRQISETECQGKINELIGLGRYSPAIIEYARYCPRESIDFFCQA